MKSKIVVQQETGTWWETLLGLNVPQPTKTPTSSNPPPIEFFGLIRDRPFIMAYIGRKGSGKSTLLVKLLTTPGGLYKQFTKIYIFSPTFRLQYDSLFRALDPSGIEVFEKITDTQLRNIIDTQSRPDRNNCLVIFDDCCDQLKKFAELENCLVSNSRHMKLSILTANQKLCQISTTTRSQTDTFCVWSATSQREIDALWAEVAMMSKREFHDMFLNVTSGRYDFLVCSLIDGKLKFFKSFREPVYLPMAIGC